MTSSPSPSTSSANGSPSYSVFIAGALTPFRFKCVACALFVQLTIVAICFYVLRQGVLGLALMIVLAGWPFLFRCRVERDGVRLSWLFIHERVGWDEIAATKLREDDRRGVIGKRPLVLAIERRDQRRIILRGRAEILSQLSADLTARCV